jgi:hypothetical protein
VCVGGSESKKAYKIRLKEILKNWGIDGNPCRQAGNSGASIKQLCLCRKLTGFHAPPFLKLSIGALLLFPSSL